MYCIGIISQGGHTVGSAGYIYGIIQNRSNGEQAFIYGYFCAILCCYYSQPWRYYFRHSSFGFQCILYSCQCFIIHAIGGQYGNFAGADGILNGVGHAKRC